MESEEVIKFQLEQYYDILMSTDVKDKLKPFIRQFKKKNIPFIYETIVNTIQVIMGKHQIPLMKFNALMAVKLFFDTGQYLPIVLIEIFLLPIIYEIAYYRVLKRSEEGLTLYFIEKGYDATKEIKRIGFNYVLLAIEFIFMSALVKPFRTLQNSELKQDSNYAKVSKMLSDKGVRPTENYKFYIPSYVSQARKRYLKRLQKFNAEQYTEFFLKLVCDEMNLNKKCELDLKKIFVFGDAYITIPLMHICQDQLANMETNFVNKKKYLNLIGEFMKMGDIYAVLIITRSTFLETIFQKIQKVKGQTGFQAGQTIYPQVQASKADKKQFYIQFLKHVELWANCHPVDEEGEPTDAKRIFDVLKNQKKFVFPSNILINKIRAEMQTNLKQNQRRNELLIKLVDEHSSYDSVKKKFNSSFRQSKLSRTSQLQKGNSYIECDQLQQMVLQAKKKLTLIVYQQKVSNTIKDLQKFKKFWHANAEKNQIQADESGDIEIVLQQGELCVKIIEMVLPVYGLYQKNKITFEEYKDKVELLMKNQAQQEKKQTSFDQNLPLNTQKSGFKENFDDCYQKSSLSRLHSNIKDSNLSAQNSNNRSKNNGKIQSQVQELQEYQSNINKSKNEKKIEFNNNSFEKTQNEILFTEKMESKFSDQINFAQNNSSHISAISIKSHSKRSIKVKSSLLDQEIASPKRISQYQYQQDKQLIGKLTKKVKEDQLQNSFESKRSSKSKRILVRRNQSSLRKRNSNLSKQSQSKISQSNSARYKDVLFKNNNNSGKQYNDYYQENQSFISSLRSVVSDHQVKVQAQPNIRQKGKDIVPTEIIKIDQQSISFPQNQVIQKNGKTKTSRYKNQDYFGPYQLNNPINKPNQNNNCSNNSSRLRISQNRSPSGKKQSSLKKSLVKNGSKIGNSSIMSKNENNIQFSVISAETSKIKQQLNSNLSKVNKNPSQMSANILNNGNISLLSKYEQEQSLINQAEYNPLLHSFHEEKSISITNPSKISSFKDCFQVNNQIILSKEGDQKLLKFTKNGKISNFIETAYPKQTPKNSTIVDILSERNAKNSIQCYRNQRQKSRATENLSEKVKSLQSFNKNNRMKHIVKNQQNKNQKQITIIRNSKNNGSEPVSFYNQSETSRQKSQTNLKFEMTQYVNAEYFNQSRMINNNIYNHYFSQNKSDKTRKCMLKSKSLLIKNNQFQIGCVTNKREKYIQISLFITPLKDNIEDVTLEVLHDQNIILKLYTTNIEEIKANQQEFINMQCHVQNIPYVTPTLSIKFKNNPNYNHNQILVPIPCSFNKFLTYHPISQEYLSQFNTDSKNQDLISTDFFNFNSKIISEQKFKESLNDFAFIKKENRISQYGCQAYFRGKIYLLKFLINERGTLQLTGKNMTGDHKNTKFLQFLLITFRQIFQNSKKQKAK